MAHRAYVSGCRISAWLVAGALLAACGGQPATHSDEGPVASQTAADTAAQTWPQPGSALTHDGGAANDRYGYTVAVSGDTAVVSSPYNTGSGSAHPGEVRVFTHGATGWAQQGPALTASDGSNNDLFGYSLALSGNTALIGANTNHVYVFVRNGSAWTQQAELTGPSGPTSGFGFALSVSGDTAVVGAYNETVNAHTAQGGAYVYVRSGTTWTLQGAELKAADGVANDYFGYTVAVSGDTALVSAPSHVDAAVQNPQTSGCVYVFVRTGSSWAAQGPALLSSNPLGTQFGHYGVSIAGDRAIVGAPNDTVNGSVNQGAAYVFARTGTTWALDGAALTASDGASGDQFGSSVSISGSHALVGAWFKNATAAPKQGAAYVFARGTTWAQQGVALTAPGALEFGANVGISDQTAVVGAPTTGTVAGTAYAFVSHCGSDTDCVTGKFCSSDGSCQTPGVVGAACSVANGASACASGNCVDGVCCNTACTGECQACSALLTGGTDGTCVPIPADQDPQDECALGAGYPNSCAAPGVCDGAAHCRVNAKVGTVCGDTVCTNDAVSSYACNDSGACAVSATPCATGTVCGGAHCVAAIPVGGEAGAAGTSGTASGGQCGEAGASGSGAVTAGGGGAAGLAGRPEPAGEAGAAGAPEGGAGELAGGAVGEVDGACGCRVAPRSSSHSGAALALLVLGACLGRRRNRDRRAAAR
jgi:hypothetical protein